MNLMTSYWAHKLKVHDDGTSDDINVSHANLFVNLLANQQETMNENIVMLGNRVKTCSDDRKRGKF